MRPAPESDAKAYRGIGKLAQKIAIVTGGDSGIGRSVAIHFAKEGAHVVVVYLKEHADAKHTLEQIEACGSNCLLIAGDIGSTAFCQSVVRKTLKRFGRLDILINNAAEQHPCDKLEKLKRSTVERTFRTNVYGMLELTRLSLPHMGQGACIVNTTSVTAYRGSPHLIDYASTKGAIVSFTRSLSQQLAPRGIRVNAVAPGPVWTPLIPSTFSAKQVATFGSDVPMKRAADPDEIAPSFVFLASGDASFMSGQVLHPNGGEVING